MKRRGGVRRAYYQLVRWNVISHGIVSADGLARLQSHQHRVLQCDRVVLALCDRADPILRCFGGLVSVTGLRRLATQTARPLLVTCKPLVTLL